MMAIPHYETEQGNVVAAEQTPMLFQGEPDMIPTKRFCELCGVSSKTVLRLIKSRKFPGFKIGRAYFVPKTALIDYVMGGGGLNG